jgi:MOSC domain-containing protein YiiM
VANARVISVNAGRGKDADWAGKLGRTAIDNRPVTGPVEGGRLGLEGDEQADKPAHGGPEQAVYAYAREDLDWWVEQLGRELANGMFGENLTTAGVLGRAAAPS